VPSVDAWSHHQPTRISFGRGRLNELRSHAGGRALVVTSAGATRRGLTDRVRGLLGDALVEDGVTPNPTIEFMDSLTKRHRADAVTSVIAVGGGSALDVGKVVAVTLADGGPSISSLLDPQYTSDHLRRLPVVAVPTTAGTGAEVTPFATVWDREHRKHSVATPPLFPRTAIVDPSLTASLPWEETLSTGLDALSQCFESVFSRHATPVSSLFADAGLRAIPDALRTLRRDLQDDAARTTMSRSALFSGLAISQTRTGIAHSISYPLTGHLGVPHGLACSFSLPAVLEFNAQQDDGRLARIAGNAGLTGPDGLIDQLLALYADLGVWTALRRYISDPSVLLDHRDEMYTPGRADTNMRAATPDSIDAILGRSRTLLDGAAR
jgi:alcohol dehydrogenase